MDSGIDLADIGNRIAVIKKCVLELQAMGADNPCLDRNTARILASLKMLEIGFSEIADLQSEA
ncbi:MAG: hypothetical protein P8010_08065 [Desulfosarcinaceae bacterium]|jgi:hypothetical protein